MRHTPAGGHVRVAVDGVGGRARLRVCDDGSGIAPELLPRIFEPFVQGDGSLGCVRGGLGIGLTLVRDLVALHGGTVEARSDGEGRGSEFVVSLPILSDPVSAPEAVREPAELALAVRRTILVVEDNADAAEMLAEHLACLGHDVRVEPDGAGALCAFERCPPDVVLLDIGLPGMDGYEVARQLRARARGDRPFLVALTGYGQAEDRARSLEAGFDLHLTKPVDLDTIARLVASAARG